MSNENIVLSIMDENNGIVTTKEVVNLGISSKTMTRLVRKNLIKKITRGVYTRPDFNDKYYMKQARARKGVFSHESSFYLHGLLDYEPETYKMTIPTHYNTRIITHEDNEFYYLKKELCSDGIVNIYTEDDNLVSVYDIDRSICDLIKDKKRISEAKLLNLFDIYMKYNKKDVLKAKKYSVILSVEPDFNLLLSKYI